MTQFTRRNLLALAGATSLSACTFNTARGPSRATADVALRTLVGEGDRRAIAGAGFVVMRNGEVIASSSAGDASGLDPTEGAPKRPFTINTPFRAASISKLAVALMAHRLAEQTHLSLDDDLLVAFPAPLRHPDFEAGHPITLRRLLSHTSTFQDPEQYWIPAPGNIRSLIHDGLYRRTAPGGSPQTLGPGDWFEYANINYGVAATIMEMSSGSRFDVLARDLVILPLRLEAGFNWSG
ncbi:MAG: serine hydrolase domain-containing protein, partial [Pseudomonadota bacterium]